MAAKFLKLATASMFAAMLATPTTASAFTIVDGLKFSFFNDGLVADLYAGDGESDTYAIRVVLDSSGYTGADTDYIKAVDIKGPDVGASWNAEAGALNSTTAPGTWGFFSGDELNAKGCNEKADSPANCAQYTGGALPVLDGSSLYTWIFHIDVDATSTLPLTGLHFKALWFNDQDEKVGGLISQNFTFDTTTETSGDVTTEVTTDVTTETSGDVPVPEPATLLLLGTGLAATRLSRRRKQ